MDHPIDLDEADEEAVAQLRRPNAGASCRS